MAQLNSLPRGYDDGPNQGRPRNSTIYVGTVMANADVQKMGRLSLWIPELGGDPANPASWIVASYASPFAGCTDIRNVDASSQLMAGSQQSYGWWATPPDLNNEVLVCFVNGDLARGFWFACLWQQNMNHMIPGIANNYAPPDPSTPNQIPVEPVVEYNKKNVGSVTDPIRPVFTPLRDGLGIEGLTRDYERGPSSTSARREAPSKVFGYLTPHGNTVHVDDNEDNEFIRLRTRSGTQIMIHESTGFVYINSKLGNAWLEVSDSGVDVYSANAVSIRAEKDFNVRADGNMFFDAGGSINLRAATSISLGAGANIELLAASNIRQTAAGSMQLETAGGNLLVRADGSIHMQATADITEKAAGKATRDAPIVIDNGGQSPAVASDEAVIPVGKNAPNVRITGNGPQGVLLNTITSRMPTHEPWVGHPHRGVPGTLGEMESPYPLSGMVPTGTGMVASDTPQEQQCGVAKAKAMSNTAHNAFKEGTDKTGVPMALLMAVGDRESGFNAGARASKGSASGLMQITSPTFAGLVHKYGAQDQVTSDPFDTRTSVLMGARYLQESTNNLHRAGVANPTYGQIYSGYFLGPSDQAKFANAVANNPSVPVSQLLPTAYHSNKNAMTNPDGSVMSAKQFSDSLDRDIGGRASAYAGQYDLPPPCDVAGAKNTQGQPANQPSAGGTPAGTAGAYKSYVGTKVANGQCVRYVQAAANLPNTSQWIRGEAVAGNTDTLAPGTPIATFDPAGTYGNHEDGRSHAAIYDHSDSTGIWVYDQNVTTPNVVGLRHITYSDNKAPCNNANQFYVINLKK